jgi:hypothetical protein
MEEWKPVPGFCFCEASNLGRIRTVYPYSQTKRGRNVGSLPRVKVLSLSKRPNGYLGVGVFNALHQRRVYTSVHRLVALAFLDAPLLDMEVNHKNFIRSDNRVENLEWLSKIDNLKHSFKRDGRSKICSPRIDPTDFDLPFIRSLLARGVNPNNLKRIFTKLPQLCPEAIKPL